MDTERFLRKPQREWQPLALRSTREGTPSISSGRLIRAAQTGPVGGFFVNAAALQKERRTGVSDR